MAFDYIGIGFSLFVLAIYLAALFFLFKIKARLTENLSETIIYFRIAIILLIILRVQTILTKEGFLAVPYLQEILALILALFLLAAFYSFYNAIYNQGKTRRNR
ncbi:hypothetical protein HYT25_04435 [Candidatus Pacearchaeota archaeon]|nr:hypothetical protein [Candidatus Pacearchaeota archaeon]